MSRSQSSSKRLLTANQLVPVKFQIPIKKCNSRTVLPNLPCPKPCKIIGEILKDHSLSAALTSSAPAPIIYMQQFWHTVKQVENAKDTIRFKIDQQEVDFTLDMFRTVLQLPQATTEKPFVPPAEFLTIAKFIIKIVGYEGPVSTASDFLVKNLTQPWQTLFKVLNRCTTSRRTGHDQTKLNTLQMFWAVVNNIHVDYARLIWTDFVYQVLHSGHEFIQYPRYTKLIIAHLFDKYPSIPRRVDQPSHNIKDDNLMKMTFSTGVPVKAAALRIPDNLLAEDMKQTDAYTAYDADYKRVDVPRMQPSPAVSTQGTTRTLSAPRSPNPKNVSKTKKKQAVGESSEPTPLLKIKIVRKKSDPIIPVPTVTEIERDQLTEAKHTSLAEAESAKEFKARANVAQVENVIIAEQVDKMVEGDDEVDELGFADSLLLLRREDPGSRLEPGSYKESPEEKEDDETDNDDQNDRALIRKKSMGSSEVRNEEKQTPISTPPRSPRIDLSPDKAPAVELTNTDVPMTDVPSPSKSTSKRAKHIRGVIARVTRCRNQMIKTMKKNFVHRREVEGLCQVSSVKNELSSLVTQEIAATAPQQIEDFLRNYMQNHALTFRPSSSVSSHTSISDMQHQLYMKIKNDPQSQAADSDMWKFLKAKFEKSSAPSDSCRHNAFRKHDHDDHPDDDVPPERKKKYKKSCGHAASLQVRPVMRVVELQL